MSSCWDFFSQIWNNNIKTNNYIFILHEMNNYFESCISSQVKRFKHEHLKGKLNADKVKNKVRNEQWANDNCCQVLVISISEKLTS